MATKVHSVQRRWRWQTPLVWGVVLGILFGAVILGVYLTHQYDSSMIDDMQTSTLTATDEFPPVLPRPLSLPDLPTPKQSLSSLTVVSHIETTDPVIFVTIDDGVSKPVDAAQFIIDHKLPVVAFLTTSVIEKNTDYFIGLKQAGISIANHTLTHPVMTSLPYNQQESQVCGASDQIEQWFGSRPTLFRPPYGEYNAATEQAAIDCGISHIIMWNVVMDRGELSYRRPEGLAAGDIVLLHFRQGLKHELELLSQAAAERGLRFARLEDYLAQ